MAEPPRPRISAWFELSFVRDGDRWIASIDVLTLEDEDEPMTFSGATQNEAAAKALRRLAQEMA